MDYWSSFNSFSWRQTALSVYRVDSFQKHDRWNQTLRRCLKCPTDHILIPHWSVYGSLTDRHWWSVFNQHVDVGCFCLYVCFVLRYSLYYLTLLLVFIDISYYYEKYKQSFSKCLNMININNINYYMQGEESYNCDIIWKRWSDLIVS